jgi:hypothetical protein
MICRFHLALPEEARGQFVEVGIGGRSGEKPLGQEDGIRVVVVGQGRLDAASQSHNIGTVHRYGSPGMADGMALLSEPAVYRSGGLSALSINIL